MDKNLLRLSQLRLVFRQNYDVEFFENFLKRSGLDLNHQINNGSTFEYKYHSLDHTALHYVVIHEIYGRDDVIELFLRYGADFTRKDDVGFTPLRLTVALRRGVGQDDLFASINDIPGLNVLLSAHVKYNNVKNPSCNSGISHFHIACLADNVPVAKFFLEAGVSVNEYVNETSDLFPRWSPLHFAVRYGSKDLVELLLTYDADLNHVDGNGLTPLRLLVDKSIGINDYVLLSSHRHLDNSKVEQELLKIDTLIELLINKSGDVNAVDDIGLSVFHVSCTMRDTTLVERLLKLGANVECKVNFDSPAWPAYTLHFAARCNPQIFKLLVKRGADVLAKDAKGITPLDLFIHRYEAADIRDVFKLHPELDHIQFDNGLRLVDVICAMKQTNEFCNFIQTVDVNSRLPENSPLWPGYAITHLAVAMEKVTYRFHHDYFVKKNHFSDKSDTYRFEDDTLIKDCLCAGANLTMQDVNGMTPLHLAFCIRKTKIVDQILKQMVSSNDAENCVDREGLSHLHIACIVDNVIAVAKFLECGFDPYSPTRNDLTWYGGRYGHHWMTYRAGSTLYHIAAKNDSTEMIEAISKSGPARMDLLDADGLTALQVCFLYNSMRTWTLRTMLPLLSDTERTNYVATSAGGLSHLHLACYAAEHSSINVLKNLLSVASRSDVITPIGCTTLNNSLYPKSLASYAGWTPLHFAALNFHVEIIDLLISKGADILTRNDAGLNSLHLALNVDVIRDVTIIKRLYQELKTRGEWNDDFGITRLHIACILEDEDEIKQLLKAGEDINAQIDVNSPIRPGETALHILMDLWNSKDNVLQMITLLLNLGADLSLKSARFCAWNCTWDCTPLHLLKKDEKVALLFDILSKAGSRFYEINSNSAYGLSFFHISCRIGNVKIIKNFIDSGVNVNEPVNPFASEYAGDTPLHIAVRHEKKKVVKLLLRKGADWKIENSFGFTPIQEAAQEHPSVFVIFFQHSHFPVDVQAQNVFGDTALGMLLDRESNESSDEHESNESSDEHESNESSDERESNESSDELESNESSDELESNESSDERESNESSDERESNESLDNMTIFQNLVDIGVRINFADPPAKKEDIATLAWKLDNDIFSAFVERATDVTSIDTDGKNILHSVGSFYVDYKEDIDNELVFYALNVKLYLDRGCDINLRDNLGRTPLHYASMKRNSGGLDVLLLLGADVNVRDNQGYTAFSYLDNKNSRKEVFLYHILMMSISGLDLDESLQEIVRNEYVEESVDRQYCNSDLKAMENLNITGNITLRHLLTEKMVRNFPHLHVSKREKILEFLSPERLSKNYEDWGSWTNLFMFQYWKILHRSKLIQPAVVTFERCIYQLDLLCIELIVKNLSNKDLENLIKI